MWWRLNFIISDSIHEVTMQVIDQPESFNLLNTLLFNIPNNPGAYSSCAQVTSMSKKCWRPRSPGKCSAMTPTSTLWSSLLPLIPSCDNLSLMIMFVVSMDQAWRGSCPLVTTSSLPTQVTWASSAPLRCLPCPRSSLTTWQTTIRTVSDAATVI